MLNTPFVHCTLSLGATVSPSTTIGDLYKYKYKYKLHIRRTWLSARHTRGNHSSEISTPSQKTTNTYNDHYTVETHVYLVWSRYMYMYTIYNACQQDKRKIKGKFPYSHDYMYISNRALLAITKMIVLACFSTKPNWGGRAGKSKTWCSNIKP